MVCWEVPGVAAVWVAGGAGHKLKTVPSVPDSPADGRGGGRFGGGGL